MRHATLGFCPGTRLPLRFTPVGGYRGDRYEGFTASFAAGEAPDEALASALLVFRESPDAAERALALDTDSGGLTITDATAWSITVEPLDVDLPAGNYVFALRCFDANGDAFTVLTGDWRIDQDTTR